MKAIFKPRVQLENRPVLQDLIPLETPFIINVDPSDKCPLQCKFCPTGNRELMKRTSGRNNIPMSFELFQKIIEDICKFPKPIKVLRLYKDGEPLVNPNFTKMIKLAKKSKCCEIVDTTTNAILLSPKKNMEIIEAGIDRINISIYGIAPEQYEKFCRYKVNFNKLVANISHLYENRGECKIIVKINGDIISKDDEKKFLEIFGDICDEVSIEHVANCWPEFKLNGVQENSKIGIYGQPIKEVLVCPYIFYSLSINSDGIASTCFLDWQRKLIIGDVNKETVVDIWNGITLRNYQKMMLRGERKIHPVCGNCDQLLRGMPDDIDYFRKELLKRF